VQETLFEDMDTPEPDRQNNGEAPAEPGFKKTKVGWIPEEWEVIRLGDVMKDISAGYSANSEDRNIEEGEMGVLKVSAVSYGTFDPSAHKAVVPEERELTKLPPKAGTLIMSRSNSEELVGRSVYVSQDYPDLRIPDTLWQVEVEDDVSARWLNFALASDRMRAFIQSTATGTSGSMKKLAMKRLRSLKIAVPPAHEQQRIADLLSTWDRAIKQINDLIAAKERRKKALMQRLLTGKTRFEGYVRQKDSNQREGMKVPADWGVHELGDFVSRQRSRYESGELPDDSKCIELGSIDQGTGRLLEYDTFESQSSSKYAFEEGQVLFGKLRPSLKKFWHAEFDGVCSTEIWVLDADDSICLNDYLFYLTQSARFQQASRTTSGTRMPRASWDFLAETAFMLPPIPEQRMIVELLSTCDEEIDALHTERDALQRQKKGMMQKLLEGKIRVSPESTSPQFEA